MRALEMLREDTRAWWADTLAHNPGELDEGEEPATADAEGLRRFLEGEVLPWFKARRKELANRPLIGEQAFSQSLDPDKLERLGRYEVRLDRKFERNIVGRVWKARRRISCAGHEVGKCTRIIVFISTTRAAILMRRRRKVSNWATRHIERFGIETRRPHISQ